MPESNRNLTVGRKQYNEADILYMQREAEARVRDMQNRTRKAAEEVGDDFPPPAPRNRNWSQSPGMYRPRRRPGNQPQSQNRGQGRGTAPPPREPEPAPEPEKTAPQPPRESAEEAPPKKDGTILGDIMGALNLDEDYLLIIGLILILVNQRADTTLILALAYLLF